MKIFIDLDNTLLDEITGFNKYAPLIYKKYHNHTNLKYEEFTKNWKASLEPFYSKYLNGEISFQDQRFSRLKYSLGNNSIPDQVLNDFNHYYNQVYEDSWTIFDGWINYFTEYKNDYYLITNGSSSQQRKKLSKLSIDKYFKELFISKEIGFRKPNQEFFTYVLIKANSIASNSIVVGDSYENDIVPSIKLGIKCIWINHNKKIYEKNDYVVEVNSVDEAINELKKIHLTTAST